jgi:hypothetical protein
MRKLKYFILAGMVIAVAASVGVWHLFTQKFSDTVHEPSFYVMDALYLIKEFEKNDKIANAKYAEKIMTVKGIVTEIEGADSATNIKIGETVTGSYAIFAFQQNHAAEAKTIREGDTVAIKGSCSGGAHSEILGAEFITFKRCALAK